jgi:transposase-like protein
LRPHAILSTEDYQMSELTPIQSQVLAGLLAGKSVSAVARENGIHRSTIYEWRQQQPYFTLALDKARSRHQTAMFDFVQGLAEQALETVEELLTSEDANLRLRAAQVILRVANPGHLSTDTRSAMQFETLSDHTLARTAEPPAVPAFCVTAIDPEPDTEPVQSDTIRQNPTLQSEPSRNSRCACGSGLKYKRCCGTGRPAAATADTEHRPGSSMGLRPMVGRTV